VTVLPPRLAALLLLAGAGAGAVGTSAATTAGNAAELAQALRGARPAAALRPLQAVQGCGPAGCVVMLGGLSVDTEAGTLRRAGGQALPWAAAGAGAGAIPAAELPEVNWEPLRGFGVRREGRAGRAGQAWGQCIEFAHAGLGNSGRAQRWRTVVLVADGGRSAHRFIGYWAGCEALTQGTRAGTVSLPTVEPVHAGAAALHVVWNHCDKKRCLREADPRQLEGSAWSEDGRLRVR